MLFFLIFLLGLCIGSFLNVLIYRIPLEKSILTPSSCTLCNKKIPIFDNIPILSYVILKGKSRCCKKKISAQYPVVELIFPLLLVFSFQSNDTTEEFIFVSLFFLLMIVIIFIDWQHLIIPHVFSWSLIASGLVYNYIFSINFLNFILGAIAAAALVLITNGAYYVIKKKQGIGMGDVFLLSGIGAWLGLINSFICFFLASIYATCYIVVSGQISNVYAKIAFGSFLCLAGMTLMIIQQNVFLKNFFY